MDILRYGSRGPQVQLLQLALARAGLRPGNLDGIFGRRTDTALRRFQRSAGLEPDGIAGPLTHAALEPDYTGYALHTVRNGETLYRLATAYGSTVQAIEIANPQIDPWNLRVGETLVIPLNFPVVPTNINYSSQLVEFCCQGLAARYPELRRGEIGRSVMDRPLWLLTIGSGDNRIFYNAAHHANEWITTPLLLKFAEELAKAHAYGLPLGGTSARTLLDGTTLSVVPCVNPDGVDLVTGNLPDVYLELAREIAEAFPAIPFPDGWKANILGTDLNLQYPAGWELAKEIKYAQGFVRPAPRDYVGPAPLTAPESLAVYRYTLDFSPNLTLSYHTQGGVIYWKYIDLEPEMSREIAYQFSAVSGYLVEETPYASGFAGYKDWFIQTYNRPGYTIEAGQGVNPLPIAQFEEIWNSNLGILTLGLTVTKS